MATDVCSVIVIVRIRPERLSAILGTHIPLRLGVVVALTTHLSRLVLFAILMVYIRLKPTSLLLEIVRLEGRKIAPYVWV